MVSHDVRPPIAQRCTGIICCSLLPWQLEKQERLKGMQHIVALKKYEFACMLLSRQAYTSLVEEKKCY